MSRPHESRAETRQRVIRDRVPRVAAYKACNKNARGILFRTLLLAEFIAACNDTWKQFVVHRDNGGKLPVVNEQSRKRTRYCCAHATT